MRTLSEATWSVMSARREGLANVGGLALPAVALVLLAATGCSSDLAPRSAVSTAVNCTDAPTPAPTVAGALSRFDFTGVATPTSVSTEGGFFVITARAEGEIQELAIAFMAVVEEAGYQVAGSDGEAFEAEVFFAAGDVAAGQVVLTQSPCTGVVDVRVTLLDDPAVLRND